MCAEGTYSLGGVDACSACPEGKTSDSGAKSADECFGKFGGSNFVLAFQSHCVKIEQKLAVVLVLQGNINTLKKQ